MLFGTVLDDDVERGPHMAALAAKAMAKPLQAVARELMQWAPMAFRNLFVFFGSPKPSAPPQKGTRARRLGEN